MRSPINIDIDFVSKAIVGLPVNVMSHVSMVKKMRGRRIQ